MRLDVDQEEYGDDDEISFDDESFDAAEKEDTMLELAAVESEDGDSEE